MKRTNRLSRLLVMLVVLAMLVNSQGMTSMAGVIGAVTGGGKRQTEASQTETEAVTEEVAQTENVTESESESEAILPAEAEMEAELESETENESETETELVTMTRDVDGAVVEVSYPSDAFEEEVALQVTAITDGEQHEKVKNMLDELEENDESFSYGSFVAFDIMFLSVETGEEVEPQKEISVSIRLSEKQPEENGNTNLVHISEERGKAEVVENAQINADATEFTFQNDEFSPYVIAFSEGETEKAVTVTTADGTETDYDTLKEALDAAMKSSGATVKLNRDLAGPDEIGQNSVITVDKPVTIDLGGHTIDAQGMAGVLTIGLAVQNQSTIVKNGTLTGASSAPLTIGKKSCAGTVTLEGLNVTGNSTNGSGGGIYIELNKKGAIININKCKISNNNALGYSGGGGGIYVGSGFYPATLNISDTEISDNTGNQGGGIYVQNTYVVTTITNTTISGNTATNGSGGGINVVGTTHIEGGLISGNNAQWTSSMTISRGGGASLVGSSDSTVNGTIVQGNTATSGGGLYLEGKVTLTDVTVTGNTASGEKGYLDYVNRESGVLSSPGGNSNGFGNGGGVYILALSTSRITLDGGSITGNHSQAPFADGLLIRCNVQNKFNDIVIRNGVTISGNTTLADGAENCDIGVVLYPNDYSAALKNGTSVKMFTVDSAETLSKETLSGVQIAGASERFVVTNKEEDEQNYIVASVPEAVYVDGKNGKDENDGTEQSPFKTYEKAEERLSELQDIDPNIRYIFVKSPLTVSENATWPTEKWTGKSAPILMRYSKNSSDYMIQVSSGASLTLKNMTLDGNKSITSKAAMVKVEKDGTLTIDGALLRNNKDEAKNANYTYSGGAVYAEGSVVMKSGTIKGNSALYGGGIEVYGANAKVEVSGGSINHNTAKGVNGKYAVGGGIAAFWGAEVAISGDAHIESNDSQGGSGYGKGGNGGGIALGGPITSTLSNKNKPHLTMTGGSVNGNTASGVGGGIYLQSTAIAEISGGHIEGNHCDSKTSEYGGGGIYVNGGKTETSWGEYYADAELQLYNVIVTENTSGSSGDDSISPAGGGLAACPTSQVKIYLTDGGAIYGNQGRYQVYLNKGTYIQNSRQYFGAVSISNYMLGGGAYHWKDENGKLIPLDELQNRKYYRLNNDPDGIDAAQAAAKVWITGNTSAAGGGGIGANGNITIGTPDSKVKEISVRKSWSEGSDLTQFSNVNVWLLRKHNDTASYEGYKQLYYQDAWRDEVTFSDLPAEETYVVLEEYILQGGSHVWSANGREYQSVIDKIMGETEYRWSDEAGIPYRSEITGDSDNGYTIVNTPVKVKIDKQDADTGKSMAGAVLRIVDKVSGTVVEEWTTDGTPHELPKELLGNGTFVLEEVSAPDGYAYVPDIEFTVDAGGVITMDALSTTDAEGNTVYLVQDPPIVGSVTLTKSDKETGNVLADAEFQLYRKTDEVESGWTLYVNSAYTTGIDGTLTVGDLPANDYYFVETKAPEGFEIETDENGEPKKYGFTIGLDDADKTQAEIMVDLNVTNTPEAVDTTLVVTKQLVFNDELWNTVDATFYVALFEDEALTKRISEVQPIVFEHNDTSSTEFTGLELGKTYYVGETNEDGDAINSFGGMLATGEMFSVDFYNDNVVTMTRGDGTKVVSFRNVFREIPEYFYRDGELTVTKQLLGADGTAKKSNKTFYAGIFDDAAFKKLSTRVSQNIVTLAMNGTSSVSDTVHVTVDEDGPTTVYVTEVDKNGNPVAGAASFRYDVTVDGSTVTMDLDHLSASVVITNQERERESEEESEVFSELESEGTVPESTKSVKTGNNTPVELFIGLLLAAAVLLILLFVLKRRKRS